MKTFLAIKHPNGCYISSEEHANWEKLLFNGSPAQKTWDRNWYSVPMVPTQVQMYESQPDINHRFVLKDKTMASDRIPESMPRDEVSRYVDYYWRLNPEYEHLQSLYELVSDKQPDVLSDVKFEIKIAFEIDHEAAESPSFAYPVMRDKYNSDGLMMITNDSLRRRLIDEITIPSIYLPERPCKLTSKQTYQIIRQHIKENLDRKVAEVTSDYDFCFTVKKNIHLAIPEKYQVDINLWDNVNRLGTKKRAKPAKYEDRYRHIRCVEVFEMTSDEDKYKGYTIIPGIEGKNEEDLKIKLDAYLSGLMDFLNEPVQECEHCKGLGVVFEKYTEMPE